MASDWMYVKPAPSVKVRDPQSMLHLPDAGQIVESNSYWLRRLADGDVIVTTPPAEPRATAKSKE